MKHPPCASGKLKALAIFSPQERAKTPIQWKWTGIMTVTTNIIMNMKRVYFAPSTEMVTVRFEEGFLGLSGGQGNATGENMSVENEDW